MCGVTTSGMCQRAWDGRVQASCGLREMSVCGESCVCMCRMRWLSMGAAVREGAWWAHAHVPAWLMA